MGATPTPWEREPGGGRGAWLKGADGEWGGLACGPDDATAKANAALIVKAVNAYQPMLEALGEFCARVEAGEVRSKRTYAKFRALIALAKGEGK